MAQLVDMQRMLSNAREAATVEDKAYSMVRAKVRFVVFVSVICFSEQ